MNLRLSNIPRARRLFLGAVVAVVIVVGWVFTEPLRTGVRNHYVGQPSFTKWITGTRTGRSPEFKLEGHSISWDFIGQGRGLWMLAAGDYGWEVVRCRKKPFESISLEDVRNVTFKRTYSLPSPSTCVDNAFYLDAYDGDIVLVRHRTNPGAIYALQAVEQKDGRGHFRSRRILPGAASARGGSNAVPFTPTNR